MREKMQLVLHFRIYVLLASLRLLLQVHSQDLQPISQISSPHGESTSVNGSSAAGHCSNSVPIAGNIICREPASSVLLDGNIPTLTGLDGDMWASQLLTSQKSSRSFTEINFEIKSPSGFFQARRVEVVLFNCPEWGIAVESIKLLGSISTSGARDTIRSTRPSATSCHSLVRLCLQGPSTLPILTLQFFLLPGSTWVHVAEVTFYDDDSTCPTETTVDTLPPPMPEVTTALTRAPITTTTAATQTTVPSTTQDVIITAPEKSQITTVPDCTTVSTQCEACPSCSTSTALASVITAIATALLATVISVLVIIAAYKCHPKITPGGAETGASAGGVGHEYEEVDGGRGGMAVSDPTYMEVDRRGGGNTFQLKENEAYATNNHVYY